MAGQVTTLQETRVESTPARIDWTKPVLYLFAALLIVLIVMPLSWLAIYSVTDRDNHLTLQNFVTLFTDPDFLDPLLTTAIIATTSAVICCIVAAPLSWLVSRRRRLGIAGGAEQRAAQSIVSLRYGGGGR